MVCSPDHSDLHNSAQHPEILNNSSCRLLNLRGVPLFPRSITPTAFKNCSGPARLLVIDCWNQSHKNDCVGSGLAESINYRAMPADLNVYAPLWVRLSFQGPTEEYVLIDVSLICFVVETYLPLICIRVLPLEMFICPSEGKCNMIQPVICSAMQITLALMDPIEPLSLHMHKHKHKSFLL